MIVNSQTLSALFVSLKTQFEQGLNSAPSEWDKVATLVPSVSKSNVYSWMGKFPKLREWVGDKQIKNLETFAYTIPNKDWEATVEVDRNDLDDDNLGIYSPVTQMAGYSARTFVDENVFPLLTDGFTNKCYDGKAFFAVDHPVAGASASNYGSGSGTPWYLIDASKPIKPLIYQQRKAPVFVQQTDPQADTVFMRKSFLYGVEARGAFGYAFWQLAYASKADLTATNYATARAAMAGYTDEQGRPLNITPTLLVVPPSLEAKARDLLMATQLASGASNTWYNSAQLLVSPWL